ncbi:MAG: hypothetical protein J6R12_06270 [Bacteroidales bacterium]|nr:hypothetical protein [Bacteroidales bacterium]
MATLNQNGIDFTITNYTPTKLGNRASTATYNALVAGRGSDIINAVEIDWKGAQVAGKTLNTTGEVLLN